MLNILVRPAQGIRVSFDGSAYVNDSRTLRTRVATGISAPKKAVRFRRPSDRGSQP